MTKVREDQPVALEAGSRRRGDSLRRAIFEAVFDQLQTVGYANLTMDKVAAAAHTSKAVLYRRWASKDALVAEALLTASGRTSPRSAARAKTSWIMRVHGSTTCSMTISLTNPRSQPDSAVITWKAVPLVRVNADCM